MEAPRFWPSRVIARGRGIREVARLVRSYGGRASGWTKRAGPRLAVDGAEWEWHWYEHHGLGRFEPKKKRVG